MKRKDGGTNNERETLVSEKFGLLRFLPLIFLASEQRVGFVKCVIAAIEVSSECVILFTA